MSPSWLLPSSLELSLLSSHVSPSRREYRYKLTCLGTNLRIGDVAKRLYDYPFERIDKAKGAVGVGKVATNIEKVNMDKRGVAVTIPMPIEKVNMD